jgi:2Fe-2S ferredoxin
MPLLKVHASDKSGEVPSGMTLLEGLKQLGISIDCECDKGKYANCHLFVQDGRKSLSKTDRVENERLDTIVGVSSKSRLACLAKVGAEPVTVELLSFASGR